MIRNNFSVRKEILDEASEDGVQEDDALNQLCQKVAEGFGDLLKAQNIAIAPGRGEDINVVYFGQGDLLALNFRNKWFSVNLDRTALDNGAYPFTFSPVTDKSESDVLTRAWNGAKSINGNVLHRPANNGKEWLN